MKKRYRLTPVKGWKVTKIQPLIEELDLGKVKVFQLPKECTREFTMEFLDRLKKVFKPDDSVLVIEGEIEILDIEEISLEEHVAQELMD